MANDRITLGQEEFKEGPQSFKTVPGGIYRVRIFKDLKIKPSKKSGRDQLNVRAVVLAGPHKKSSIFDNVQSHVNFKINQLLHAIQSKKIPPTLRALAKMIQNAEVRVQVIEEKFNGRKQNKVVTWLPLKGEVTGAAREEEDDDQNDDADDLDDMDTDTENGEEQDDNGADDDDDNGSDDGDDDQQEEDADDDNDDGDDDASGDDDDDDSASDDGDEPDEEPAEEEEEEKPAPRRGGAKRPAAKTATPAKRARTGKR
jgi:cobalamin biosynthesis protein CobT